jgi:hypothetical protein
VTGVQGRTADGRPAWLLSLKRREWVVVDEATHATLVAERHGWWQKGLALLVILLAINPLADHLLHWHTSPWLGLLLANLHLLQENLSWRRRLRRAGEHIVDGARPVNLPREGFWLALSFVPLLLALPVALLRWRLGAMDPQSFLLLMLLFWALIVLEIHQARALRALAEGAAQEVPGEG